MACLFANCRRVTPRGWHVLYGDRSIAVRDGSDLRRAIEADLRQLAREVLASASAASSPLLTGSRSGPSSIRNQRSRWGSCARNGNIALNFRLVQMPAHVSRLRAAARADAHPSAESFAAVLASCRGGVPGVSRRRTLAEDDRPSLVLGPIDATMTLNRESAGRSRPWRAADARSLATHANNMNVARHLRDRFPHPYTVEGCQRVFRVGERGKPSSQLRHRSRGRSSRRPWLRSGPRRRTLLGGGRLLAGRELLEPGDCDRSAAALYAIRVHRTWAPAALRLALSDNSRSIRVLEKAGFAAEGVLRSSCVKFGKPRNQADLRHRQRPVVAMRLYDSFRLKAEATG